jgi:homoserine O-acetyltransferase/O-succinyltransferase
MQALECCLLGGSLVNSAIVMGCGARHTAWQIAISETQRQAIYLDPQWYNNNHNNQGLSLARQIAMISYRSAASYEMKFGRTRDEKNDRYQVQSYLKYQVSIRYNYYY